MFSPTLPGTASPAAAHFPVCERLFMGRFEFRVAIDRPLIDVFAVYTDIDNWKGSSFIADVRWVKGKPWVEESRMQIVTDGHIPATVDQVLMRFEPGRRADYISHVSGITIETRVLFRALSNRETEIEVQVEFVGTFSRIVGFAVEPAIERPTRQFFEDLKRLCEQKISASVPPSQPLGDAGKEASSPEDSR